MDLFDIIKEKEIERKAPLAERMKPENIDAFFGQQDIVGEGKLLRRLIQLDRLGSIILYGPPGTGKTSLAKIIAKTTSSDFVSLNAVMAGVKDIREVVKVADEKLKIYGKRTILFIDEIHRFNKSQQDALLPHVEKGVLTLIGATTENPFYEVNKALLSRSHVFQLTKLEQKDLIQIFKRALKDVKKGLGIYPIKIDEEALNFIANYSDGDARKGLNLLELCVLNSEDTDNEMIINVDYVKTCLSSKQIQYDKSGNQHYDIVSAFIKSMRGSDPDATVHYLAQMIKGGEDPKFIARRILICASEDVGNADPMALVVANNAAQAVNFVGMPEGRIILSQAAIYVACAPKSNASYMAINEALSDLEIHSNLDVPYGLKDATSLKMEKTVSQKGEAKTNYEPYKYPHNYDNHYVKQQYMPEGLKDKKYYIGSGLGKEEAMAKWLDKIKKEDA